MKTEAVRIYGKMDIRHEIVELPEISDDEVLVRVITDGMCISTLKLVKLGQEHKRAHSNMSENPCMIGHEMCAVIVKVGKNRIGKYKVGDVVIAQPAMNCLNMPDSLGFTYPYCGGNTQYAIIPKETLDLEYLIKCELPAYYYGSLAEPLSCIACAFHGFFHTTGGYYELKAGIKNKGNMAVLAGAGPMGLAAIDYALHNEFKNPARLVVTDIDEARLQRAREVYSPERAKECGVDLIYVNTAGMEDAVSELRKLTDGEGFDDVLLLSAIPAVIEQGDKILAANGCLNFFAGPTDSALEAKINFFNVHYASTHIVGTMGGTEVDMKEVVGLMEKGLVDPSPLVTHIGGLSSVVDTIPKLGEIGGGKKLIYNWIDLPLIALEDLEKQEDERLRHLGKIFRDGGSVWSPECERYLLENFCK
ncbi:MAG: zinc-binding dehydrogenase [Lachnospiraceae bacterium]